MYIDITGTDFEELFDSDVRFIEFDKFFERMNDVLIERNELEHDLNELRLNLEENYTLKEETDY